MKYANYYFFSNFHHFWYLIIFPKFLYAHLDFLENSCCKNLYSMELQKKKEKTDDFLLINYIHYCCLWTFVKINDIVSVSVAFEHFKIHLITQKFPIKCLKIFFKIVYIFSSGVTIFYTYNLLSFNLIF